MTARANRIAVFGADGQVGSALGRMAKAHEVHIIDFGRRHVDITNPRAVRQALAKAGATAVVNAAAYTAVDKAENERGRAFAVNRDGARNVAEAAAELGIPLVHISTDYVFDGTKATAYTEDDPVAPLGVYGASKAEGEAAVRAAAPRAIIARTAWVYGAEGSNFVKTMLRLGRERDVLRIVDDQRGCPTFADDLAAAILSVVPKLRDGTWGTYHLVGQGQATWFEFATAIFAIAAHHGQRVPRVEPISTADYPTPARRPVSSALDCAKAKRVFGIELPHWKDGLTRMLAAHLAAAEAGR